MFREREKSFDNSMDWRTQIVPLQQLSASGDARKGRFTPLLLSGLIQSDLLEHDPNLCVGSPLHATMASHTIHNDNEVLWMPMVVDTCKAAPVSETFLIVHSIFGALSLMITKAVFSTRLRKAIRFSFTAKFRRHRQRILISVA